MTNFLQRQTVTVVFMAMLSLSLVCLSEHGLEALGNSSEIAFINGIADDNGGYGSPVHLADLENQVVKESSGLAASGRNTGLFWTHNDSGDGPFIYAFDRAGKHRGVWRVTGAQAVDWEDMAAGPGPRRGQSYLYLGDIGDNSKKRDEIIVYRVVEPSVTSKDAASTVEKPRGTEPADVIRLKYPDGKHDAETLMIHPSTGDLYIVTKLMGAAAGVYKMKAPLPTSGTSTLVRVGEIEFPNLMKGFLTGGDISHDARRVVICDYRMACEFVLPDKRGIAFDEVWKQPAQTINTGTRKQGESICYRRDGAALLLTSEGLPCPLIEIVRTNR